MESVRSDGGRVVWVGSVPSDGSPDLHLVSFKPISSLHQVLSSFDSLLLHPEPHTSTVILSEYKLLTSYGMSISSFKDMKPSGVPVMYY